MSNFHETVTTLDTQNLVTQIAVTDNKTSQISVKSKGDFDSGNLDIGYTSDNTSGGTFIVSNSLTEDGDLVYKIGRNQTMFARVTAAFGQVLVKTTPVS